MKWESFVHAYDPHQRTGAFLTNGTDGQTQHSVRESRHVQFVREFAVSTATLQEKTDILIGIHGDMVVCLNELKTCQYTFPAFSDILHRIQDHVAPERLC
jgi:dynein heavy chain 1, cytosolic